MVSPSLKPSPGDPSTRCQDTRSRFVIRLIVEQAACRTIEALDSGSRSLRCAVFVRRFARCAPQFVRAAVHSVCFEDAVRRRQGAPIDSGKYAWPNRLLSTPGHSDET